MKTEDTEALGRRRAKPSNIKAQSSQPTCKNCLYVNGTRYCSTEIVLLICPFLQTNITSQMWPNGGKGAFYLINNQTNIK